VSKFMEITPWALEPHRERFMRLTTRRAGCIAWRGFSRVGTGLLYPSFRIGPNTYQAARLAFYYVAGVVLSIDQMLERECAERDCVNPKHFRIVETERVDAPPRNYGPSGVEKILGKGRLQ